ncbi:MAG: transketolase [Petroclostridium sp.]|jgi:transketolase|uniref:transketolase family protein n=1 Tax=Petroclostridium xylanilyticum TaxID=1792311 RepID=UPI000B995612|nr:transketolase C-terminal domain-containing protein [Petroclostridium xylanilyticum]MDK2809844.1 transketolase [Petroclostridium sp.]
MGNMSKDPRKIFAKTMLDIGEKNPRILAVSCDSASGGGMGDFIKAFPERYIEAGISEQNAIGICAGAAKQGFIPVIVAITPFITMRCYEQIRNDIGYSNMNVKIIGSGGGLAYSTLGSSHEAIEDICVMRSIPNMTILVPGDAYEVDMALREAVEHKGPVYIRMPRHPLDDIVDSSKRCFKIGDAEMIESGDDITIFASGTMVKEAQQASKILRSRGINAAVIDVHTIKPIDIKMVKSLYEKSKMFVTVEEHSVIGGLGSAIAEIIAPVKKATPLHIMGVSDGATNTGPYRELLESYSLTGEKLAVRIYELYV